MTGPGIYVHLPFCESKCHYCSFNSRPVTAGQNTEAYLEALLSQIHDMATHPWSQQTIFHSLYLGGGTPTIYSGKQLHHLLNTLRHAFHFTVTPEISIEANPNTLTFEKLNTLRGAGITRLSIGVQAFQNNLLQNIGRLHSVNQAQTAFKLARKAGFKNISLDLIFGLPSQTPADWQESLITALSLQPEHLSLYELMVEPGSVLYDRGKDVQLPTEDAIVAMMELTATLLPQHGYKRYEISNFCRPDYHCRHNINYWQNGDYLGFGAGAVSCIEGLRLQNVSNPTTFCQRIEDNQPVFDEGEALSTPASFRETVIMGLRMLEGISISTLKERFGLDVRELYGATLQRFLNDGYLVITNDKLKLSPKGMPVANQILSELI